MQLTKKNSIIGLTVLLLIVGITSIFYYALRPEEPEQNKEQEKPVAEVAAPITIKDTEIAKPREAAASPEIPELESLEGLSEELESLGEFGTSIEGLSDPLEDAIN